jgi:hypothetical protein
MIIYITTFYNNAFTTWQRAAEYLAEDEDWDVGSDPEEILGELHNNIKRVTVDEFWRYNYGV